MNRNPKKLIDAAREDGRRRGRRSQDGRRNERIDAALAFPPSRPVESYLVFVLATWNPRTGLYHYLELRHEVGDGSGRFTVWLDGEVWRNGWSRTRFAEWLVQQVDRVRSSWS